MVEFRGYQDDYHYAWKSEYENLLKWIGSKYIYQEDKDALDEYDKSVQRLIELSVKIRWTEWSEDYRIAPDTSERNSWGNGTRSRNNQDAAEIYRDASMYFINLYINWKMEEYQFLKRDYSEINNSKY